MWLHALPAPGASRPAEEAMSGFTCECGSGTVWWDDKAKKWRGCACGKVKGQA